MRETDNIKSKKNKQVLWFYEDQYLLDALRFPDIVSQLLFPRQLLCNTKEQLFLI